MTDDDRLAKLTEKMLKRKLYVVLSEAHAGPDKMKPYLAAHLEYMIGLEKRGMVLSVISNFDSRLIGILEGLGAAPWFEHIFVSSRVGYAKPDRQIFHTALERHSLKAGDALHIGDSEEKDLHGANKAGLKGVLVERNGEINSNLSPRITSLRGILPLLDDLDQR